MPTPPTPVRVNLLTNPNSRGLQRDVEVITNVLQQYLDCRILVLDLFAKTPDDPGARGADINLYLETLHQGRYLGCAQSNWLMVNPEWYLPEFERSLSQISLILSKTRHAHKLWSSRFGELRCPYIAFTSRDRLLSDSHVHRTGGFLHIAGKSSAKGTEEIAKAWHLLNERYKMVAPLTVVTCSSPVYPDEAYVARKLHSLFAGLPAVRCLHNIPEDQMTIEMNRNRCLLAPSLYEGWGQSLHEGMSAKMVIMTTDAEPMRSFPGIPQDLLVPVERTVPRYMIHLSYPRVSGIVNAVHRVLAMKEPEVERLGAAARSGWHAENDTFCNVLPDLVSRWESFQ